MNTLQATPDAKNSLAVILKMSEKIKYLTGSCVNCSQKLEFPDVLFNTDAKCPNCGATTRLSGVCAKNSRLEYQMVSSAGCGGVGNQAFFDKINEQMDKGWRPIGGVGIDKFNFYQAMIREVNA